MAGASPKLKVRSKGGRRSRFDMLPTEAYSGFLPNPQARRCTRMLKIKPFEHFVGGDQACSCVGIRADENREGFRTGPKRADGPDAARAKPVAISGKSNIVPVYPLKDIGFGIDDVRDLLLNSGLGLPPCYDWRSGSGCWFCFYQQIGEWQGVKERHPELFEAAKTYEKVNANGRRFTWTQTRSLDELEAIEERCETPIGEPEDGGAICHP